MNYEVEPWRKLYTRESTEDRLMPLFCRGLRDYLLRHAKDDGTLLSCTEEPAADLAQALTAHRTEAKLVETYVERLIRNGFLSFSDGRLWVTNFEAAQRARTPGAKRQKRYRDTRRDVTQRNESVTRDATGDTRITSQEEEKRREVEEETAAASPVTDPRFPMALDWSLDPDTRASLETELIPGWAIDKIVAAARTHFVAQKTERRTNSAWNQSFAKWVRRDWRDPNRRPKKADAEQNPETPRMQLPEGVRVG